MEKWLSEPETYYPEPQTIPNMIRWHIAITHKVYSLNREINKSIYDTGDHMPCLSDFRTSKQANALFKRDMDFFSSLGYQNIARCEAAMMLGRELFYRECNKGYSEYDDEIRDIDLNDLDKWMEVFKIPPTIEAGGNINAAVEYTFGKIPDFLQAYVDALPA